MRRAHRPREHPHSRHARRIGPVGDSGRRRRRPSARGGDLLSGMLRSGISLARRGRAAARRGVPRARVGGRRGRGEVSPRHRHPWNGAHHRSRPADQRLRLQSGRYGGRMAGQRTDRSVRGNHLPGARDRTARLHRRAAHLRDRDLSRGLALSRDGALGRPSRRADRLPPARARRRPGSYRPRTFGDPANTFHEKAVLCRAAENTCYFASVNCASEGSGTTSAIARPDGTLMCSQPYGQEGLLVADLDLTLATGLLASRCRY